MFPNYTSKLLETDPEFTELFERRRGKKGIEMDLMKEQKFGFGCMRLPLLDASDPASFDYEKIESLFDKFLEQGFTYFDTAYTYHGYQAEKAMKKALVERYPRERFQLATKMPLTL